MYVSTKKLYAAVFVLVLSILQRIPSCCCISEFDSIGVARIHTHTTTSMGIITSSTEVEFIWGDGDENGATIRICSRHDQRRVENLAEAVMSCTHIDGFIDVLRKQHIQFNMHRYDEATRLHCLAWIAGGHDTSRDIYDSAELIAELSGSRARDVFVRLCALPK